MTDERVVKVSGPAELVAAVPYLVGYVPDRAMAVLGLAGPRYRLVLSAVVPLPPPRQEQAALAPVVTALSRSGAQAVVAVVYPRRKPAVTGALPDRRMVRALRAALRRPRLRLLDAIVVWQDRWWSYECRDQACCPSAGRPLPSPDQPPPVVAALVAEGVAPTGSRAELAARLAPITGDEAEAMDLAVEEATGWADSPDLSVARDTVALLLQTLDLACDGARPRLRDEEAAQLLVGFRNLLVRDTALALVFSEVGNAAAIDLMVDLVRRAPERVVAPAAAVLAWAAYASGNGALANIALDRCLAADPDYRLAILLRHALDAGAHPDALRTAAAEIRAEIVREAG